MHTVFCCQVELELLRWLGLDTKTCRTIGAEVLHRQYLPICDFSIFFCWSLLALPCSMSFCFLFRCFSLSGDGVLTRLHKHVAPNGLHLTEQIDRNTGDCMAAKDLTWSYACTLKAMHARKGYYEAVEATTTN